MKKETAQTTMTHISKITGALFLMMMLFAKGSMAQTGEAWINNTSRSSGLEPILSSDSLNLVNLKTGNTFSVSENATSYLWTAPTGVTTLSGQRTNTITEEKGTVTRLAGASSYTWAAGRETSIRSAQDTTSIVVNPGDDKEQVKCTKNSCGSRAAATLAGQERINH